MALHISRFLVAISGGKLSACGKEAGKHDQGVYPKMRAFTGLRPVLATLQKLDMIKNYSKVCDWVAVETEF